MGGILGYHKNLEGEKCPHKCGSTLKLKDLRQQAGPGIILGGQKFNHKTACQYYCGTSCTPQCEGNKNGFPVIGDGKKTGIPLGGKGRAPAGGGLLCICLATQPWSKAHPSVSDITLIQGIGLTSTQVYLDETRRKMAELNIQEQQTIKFKNGQLMEWDECGIRAERRRCKSPCALCGATCIGHRLIYNRWIIGIARGDRRYTVVEQLPFESCDGEGGGIPLSGRECDRVCPKYLTKGAINLTDGASPYEAFAAGDIACSPDCARKDCLARVKKEGKDVCSGWRPREGRARFELKYKHLKLAHGVVSHKAEEWSLVKQVRVWDNHGRSHLVKLKHGTEVPNGAWAEVKRAYPRQVKSSDRIRLAEYVNAWAWKARRHGEDIFREFAKAS